MRRLQIILAPIMLCFVCSAASADIYSWTDENGVRHFTNYAPPAQAKVIMKTEELPYDEQADNERQESERLDQLADAWQAIAEKESQLADMQLEAEERIEAANRKAQAALEQAESLLNQAQDESYDSANSGYGYIGYYPYYWGYNHSIYNRWYYGNGGRLYRKHHHKYWHKHGHKKKRHYTNRRDYQIREDGHRRYQTREYRLQNPPTVMRGGFGYRGRTFGQRPFGFNRLK